MLNSVAKKLFAVGLAGSTVLMALAPFAAHAAVHAAGTNVLETDGTIAMVGTDGMLHAYTSAGAFLSYGFNSFASTVTASPEDMALAKGSFIPPQDGSIICSDRGADKGTCYFVSAGMKYGFTSAAVFTGLGFSFAHAKSGDVSWMTAGSTLISSSSQAHMTGALINKNGTVYLVGANGNLLGIPDLNTFNSWGYSFNNVVPANAADTGSQTGVMAMRMAGQLSPSWTTGTNNPPTVVNGSVSASLSSDSPASASIVAGQAIADLAHFSFSGTGTVTQVVLKRIGVSADATLSNVYLYNGNTKLTDAGSVSNSTVTFSNANGLFTVNGNVTISVKSDIATGTSGQTVGAQLASYSVANGSPMATSISGNLMTIATATLATVTVGTPTGPGSSINAGTLNASLWNSSVTVSTRSVWLKYISLKQVGSAQPSALQNLKLYVDGAQVGGTASLDSNNNVAFDLTGSPVTLNTGSHNVELRGDVVAGSSYTFSFRVQTVSDIVLVDSNYSVNLSASGTFPAVPTTTTTISNGTITVQTDSTFNATQVVKNSSNVTLGQWTLKAYGENVKVQSLAVNLVYTGSATSTEGFNNLAIYVNGVQQGSSQNMIVSGAGVASATSSAFGSTNLFTVPAGQTVTVAVKGDMVNLTSGSTWTAVQAKLAVSANSMQGLTSFNTSPSANINYPSASSLSIVSSSVTLSSDTGFASQTVPANVQNQKVASFTIQNSNAESVRVSSLTLSWPAGNTISPTTTLADLYIVTPQGNSATQPPSASNNFPVSFTLAPSQTVTISVYASITNATGNLVVGLTGQGNGVSSGQTVYINATGASGGAAVSGQTITVGNGTITTPYATLQSSSPVAQFVLGGTTNQPLGTFNVVSSNGGVTITELGFLIATSSGATTVPVTAVSVNGGTAQPVVGATSTITGLNISVPSGFNGTNISVTGNFASVNPVGGMVSNQTATTTLSYIKYTSGGSTTIVFPSVAANPLTVVAGIPTVSLTAPASGNLTTGTVKIGSVVVSAAATPGGDILLNQLPITVATSGGANVASGTAIIVKDSSNNTTITTTDPTFNNAGADTVTFTNGYRISAGTSKTFDIYAVVSGSLGNAGTSRVSLGLGASSSFLWTDVNGNLTGITGSKIYNYPNTTVGFSN